MKFKYLSMIGVCTLTSLANAAFPLKPDHCPSVKALKAQNFHLYKGASKGWVALKIDSFVTKEKWAFLMGYFNDNNVNYANDYLQKLAGLPSPIFDPSDDSWNCTYKVQDSYLGAIAYTLNQETSSFKTSQLP